MASSPPASPGTLPQRPLSAMVRPAPRSNSRMSVHSKAGGGSRASDEDGRTSVKVAVRVRPPLRPTDPGFELIPQRFQRPMVHVNSDTSLSIDAPQGRKLFVFDRVFGPEVDQAGIWDYLDDCVNAFTQGYNVSLLAYGQSGAGKSYTMGTSGPLEQDDLEIMGVIPRAATALFEKLEGPSPKGNPNRSSMSQLRAPARYSQQAATLSRAEKTWSLKATYVEIYNEQLRDLLIPEHVPAHERGTVTIREDVKGNIILTGLRQVEINSVEDLMNALNQGSTLRQTDATAINARSSRSHAVFSLNLVQKKNKATTSAEKRFSVPLEAMSGTEAWVTTDSKMHFVDLAGSERLKNTGAQGERAKEGISINAGLAALGKVISQLSSRQAGSHVSYRDSKLTRLLQDSLGGNAITYMIACVTPAEFHLSETLNTVQYAQRARAIQSKPRIQQVEEGDKQAIIDRLKAEVAFLREQIRSAERGGGERRTLAAGERSERQNEREVELQNQLLDAQENYTALSQRHARLIAEMAKARDNELAENQHLESSLGDSATERLNRSNSFAQAVEQVVLEYEKTIQALEQSLASTRGTLANTETSLLEKETKCAYNETINNQLQARLQKLMDREASTENYLHDLEAKLDGHTSGEEKNATIIMELRKEIARVRENEAACEDYISTLEERLAEADQDAELMQREIDRLEQVVERQRSLGKLDSLLYELDHIQQDAPPVEPEPVLGNGAGHRRAASRGLADHSRSQSHVSRHSHMEEPIPESGEEDEELVSGQTPPVDEQSPTKEATPKASHLELVDRADAHDYPASPAQSKFVADKLESVTQELVDLRVEHESTMYEYDLLQRKYEEALRAFAELQDMVDEAKHPSRQRDSLLSVTSPIQTRPPSFLSDARSSETKDGTHFSGTRSLSSELSSAMESPATVLESDTETAVPRSESDVHVNGHDPLQSELGRLKTIAAQKESAERELAERYAQLENKHQETLDMVEELKTEVAKAQAANSEGSSPRTSTPIIRRKSSQNVMIIDRAHRSFASLRNIAAENFENQPDVMQNFELNLNAAMHELHARSERIQELEADVNSAKKEMETKMAIISGLTRERSSLKAASPMDMAVVSTLREQLAKSEKQMRELQESHAARESELQQQLAELQEALKQSAAAPTQQSEPDQELLAEREAQAEKISALETELVSWEGKHAAALQSMQAAEEELKKTIGELESQVATFNAKLAEAEQQKPAQDEIKELESKHQQLVEFLRSEIDEYKGVINSNSAKVAEVEEKHAATKALLDVASRDRDQASAEAKSHKVLIAKLESQLEDHEQTVKQHQESLHELQSRHVKELDEMRTTTTDEYEAKIASLKADHANQVKKLDSDLTEAREELMKVATQVAFALGLDVSVERISERIEDLIADQKALAQEQKKRAELERHVVDLSGINDTVMRDLETIKATLSELLADSGKAAVQSPIQEQAVLVKKKMADLDSRNKKNSRLIEELEDQLQNNFDQAQVATNRLSTLQSERNAQLEEANAAKIRLQTELETIKEEYASLQARYDGLHNDIPHRSNSNGHLKKSPSVASLPSPPPAIPLPPLPGNSSGAVSPTPGRPASKDIGHSQIQEDQEARIRLIEKHLMAEKQLTATLEEALTDLERQQNKIKADCDAWRRRANELETEMKELKEKPQQDNRWSLQQVEEERRKRRDAEIAHARLEERMNTISKKKKKGSLNCF
ncbi:chromosome-associated kinesin KIF4B [Podospora aff. communis PSN243]|uniref:Chromosome-associated kinesin KIF4B n=1 Tax=Podospora aff. communis PSN243 TaxID=3040156 RepID=A0AAV9H354_9PEZI|nr:chromosome-associated kinesin KIF4B [Podospora aff. communis PSN243]